MPASDRELIAEYADTGSESAFAAVAGRYSGLVYSAALRMTANSHDAEEVTQAVFIILARKAKALSPKTVLAGWLYQTARLTAGNFVRSRTRRERREKDAYMETTKEETPPWKDVAPILEVVMVTLGKTDRDALVLRYFENRSNREVGVALNTSEAAAHQRISRALEKLRRAFARRGLAFSAGVLSATLAANAVRAAPAALNLLLSQALREPGVSGLLAQQVIRAAKLSKVKASALSVAGILGAAVGIWLAIPNLNQKQDAPHPASATTLGDTATVPPPEPVIRTRYRAAEVQAPAGFSLHIGGMNNFGQIVGSLDSPANATHSFIWDRGVVTDLGTFGAAKSLATGINDSGEIVGLFLTNGVRHVFLYQNGALSDLGVLDHFAKLGDEGDKYNGGPGIIYYAPRIAISGQSQVTGRLTVADGNQRSFLFQAGKASYFGVIGDGNMFEAEAINNRSQILGRATQSGGPMRSMLWQNGTLTDLGALEGTRSTASAISDQGIVVGTLLWTNESTRAFSWDKGTVRRRALGNARNTHAAAINNAGQIVGNGQAPNKSSFACLWQGDELIDLNELTDLDPGWRLKSASAINARGQILASAANSSRRRNYLLSPLDQPLVEQPEAPKNSVVSQAQPIPSLEPFNLTGFERLPNGAFRLSFMGGTNAQYVIESSTNLAQWEGLGPATSQDGRIEFTDNEAPKFVLRFYRARAVQ